MGIIFREVNEFLIQFYIYLKLKTNTNNTIFRPTMIKYGINNIRDLVGHKVNLKMVYENPICRIEK